MTYRIPRDFITLKDEIALKLRDKNVQIYGSLAQVFHNLLNETMHDSDDSQEKRAMTTYDNTGNTNSFEDFDIPRDVIRKIEFEESPTAIFVEYQDRLEPLEEGIIAKLERGNKIVLVTEHPKERKTMDELKEMHNKLVSLENRVLEKNGIVYRIREGISDGV